jgi:hypothetical protein
MSQSAQSNGAVAAANSASGPGTGGGARAPAQPSPKADAAAPKLDSADVEMGTLPSGDVPVDIMHLARVGDVASMEKLFTESPEYDATYADHEGITPLHVRCLLTLFLPTACFAVRCPGDLY